MRVIRSFFACLILSVSASAASQPVTVGHFAFRIDEGISLHHYLHQWARRLELDGKIQPRLLPDLGLDPHETPAELDETEQRTWTAAINYYRENFTGQNLVFSERNNKLLAHNRETLAQSGIYTGLSRAHPTQKQAHKHSDANLIGVCAHL